MTSPSYGFLHRGTAVAYDADADGWTVRVAALAPGRTMGPFPTMAAGVQEGERVVLASIGTSRDDLIILGRVPSGFPDIEDIPGLTAALAGKADDSEITTINGTLTALDGRLDVVEPLVTAHGVSITSLVAADVALTAADTALSNRLAVAENAAVTLDPERDLYSDLLSSTHRAGVSAGMALTNGTIYLIRLYTRRAIQFTQVRMVTSVAGTVGTASVGVYTGAALTAMTLVASASISLTTLGRTTALPSTTTIPSNSNVLIAVLPLAFTVAPQLGATPAVVHTSLLNPNAGLATIMTKTGQVALPSTINTTDGTWGITGTFMPWVALGGALV